MPRALEFERIMKEYRSWSGRRRIRALQDFSLTVECGEIFGFLGPNGRREEYRYSPGHGIHAAFVG